VPIGASMLEIRVRDALTEAKRIGKRLYLPPDVRFHGELAGLLGEPYSVKQVAYGLCCSEDMVYGLIEAGWIDALPKNPDPKRVRDSLYIPRIGVWIYLLRIQGMISDPPIAADHRQLAA